MDHDLATVWVQEQFPEREPQGEGLSLSLDGNRGSVVLFSFNESEHMNIKWWAGKVDSDSGGLAGQCPVENPSPDTFKMLERFLVSGRRKVLDRWQQRGRLK